MYLTIYQHIPAKVSTSGYHDVIFAHKSGSEYQAVDFRLPSLLVQKKRKEKKRKKH